MQNEKKLNLAPGKRQLFIDPETALYYFGDVRRKLATAARHPANPVIVPEHPWEGKILAHPCVHRDETTGRYRMWYQAFRPLPNWRELGLIVDGCGGICYAESSDGIHWEKPELGLVEFGGNRKNNILLDVNHYIDYPAVIIDDQEPDPKLRYKMLLQFHKPGAITGNFIFTSPDGLRWDVGRQIGMVPDADTHALFRHPGTREYLIFSKYHDPKRVRTLIKSPDLVHFSPPEVILAADERDPDACDLYYLSVEPYEGIYLGLLGIFYHVPERQEIDITLAFSEDAYVWKRIPERHPLLYLGEKGSFDQKTISVGSKSLVRLHDRIQMFYAGCDGRHDGELHTQYAAIGLAEIRRDGFVCIRGGKSGGGFITAPAELNLRDTFHVNCACQEDGCVEIEVLKEDAALDEKSVIARALVAGDRLDREVQWSLPHPGHRAAVTPCRLRFTLKNAELFSIWTS